MHTRATANIVSTMVVGARQAAIRYPKLARPPLYSHFIEGIVRSPPNLKHFLLVDKAELDAQYEAQLRAQGCHEDAAVRKWLADVSPRLGRQMR